MCDQKQLLNDDPGCCPVCPSLYKTITGGYEVFGGPFGPGVESNIAHQSNKVRPFVEKAGEELGLDPSTAVQETTVGEIGKSLFTKAKIDQAEAHNVMVDKHMKEETKRLKKLENKMREAHAFKLKLLNGVLDD